MSEVLDPVNERLPPGKLVTLGLQHVLVMYAGAIAAPLIVARVRGLNVLFNGSGSGGESDARDAALAAEGSH